MPHTILITRSAAMERSKRVLNRPAVVHLRETLARFGARLGMQFAGAITYFLVLALIPTLMFAFAALGFTLDVVRPELKGVVVDWLQSTAPGEDQLVAMLENFLANWATVGIIGIVSALYTAQGFIGNLKDAVRAQLTDHMDDIPKESFPMRIINNILTLLGLLIGAAITIAGTIIGTGLATTIADWLNLPGWFAPLLNIGTIVLTAAMAWVMFMFMFTMIPHKPVPIRTRIIGSLVGALALTLLLNIATVLIDLFSSSPTAALFGPIIAIMLSMNIFIRIVLMIAAWMGTTHETPVFDTVAEAEDDRAGTLTAQSTSENALALLAATGLVLLTILGLKKYEEKFGDS